MKTKKFETYLKEIEKIAAEEGYDSLDPVYAEHLRCRFMGEPVMIAESKRLRLREMCPSDLESFASFGDAWCSEILRPLLGSGPEEADGLIRSYIRTIYPFYDYGMWTVERKEDGAIVGICGLGNCRIGEMAVTDAGYYIAPEYRRQGYGEESTRLAITYAKEYLELPELYIVIEGENAPSKALAEKLGFVRVMTDEVLERQRQIYQKQLK